MKMTDIEVSRHCIAGVLEYFLELWGGRNTCIDALGMFIRRSGFLVMRIKIFESVSQRCSHEIS